MGLKKQLEFLLDSDQSMDAYIKSVDNVGVFDNRFHDAYPQTVVAELVRDHFQRTASKKPKAIIIGFDGARADGMLNLVKSTSNELTGDNHDSLYSAVCALKKEGGLYLTYAGGVAGDKETMQETSTAQGWASVLTGAWAKDHGVVKNDIKRADAPTVLMELARKGYHTAFNAIWPTHFDTTYKAEIAAAQAEDVPLIYQKFENDLALHDGFFQSIDDDVDCMIGIYEAPDSNGHGCLFGNKNYKYCKSIADLDRRAYAIMEHIKARPTYGEEDWLILITSDHGGHKTWHGTQSVQDRMTFLASNKKIRVSKADI